MHVSLCQTFFFNQMIFFHGPSSVDTLRKLKRRVETMLSRVNILNMVFSNHLFGFTCTTLLLDLVGTPCLGDRMKLSGMTFDLNF